MTHEPCICQRLDIRFVGRELDALIVAVGTLRIRDQVLVVGRVALLAIDRDGRRVSSPVPATPSGPGSLTVGRSEVAVGQHVVDELVVLAPDPVTAEREPRHQLAFEADDALTAAAGA